MNRSKVEEQEGRIHAFKGKFGPKIVADWCGSGSDFMGRGSDSLGRHRGFNPATNRPRFCGELAPIVGRSGHDRTAIVSHNRTVIVSHNRTVIVSHDRGSLLIAAVWSDQVGWAVLITRSSSSSICRPMEMKIPLGWLFNLRRGVELG